MPSFEVDGDLNILYASQAALSLFGPASNFLEIVDNDSRTKARRLLHPTSHLSNLELNLVDTSGHLLLFEVSQHWRTESGHAQIACWSKDDELLKVVEQLRRLQEQVQYGSTLVEVPPSPKPTVREDSLRTARMHVRTMRDLLHILRPTLVDAGKTAYVTLLEAELDQLEDLFR
jgi:hypothetical protein